MRRAIDTLLTIALLLATLPLLLVLSLLRSWRRTDVRQR
jgi:hypothetical protein